MVGHVSIDELRRAYRERGDGSEDKMVALIKRYADERLTKEMGPLEIRFATAEIAIESYEVEVADLQDRLRQSLTPKFIRGQTVMRDHDADDTYVVEEIVFLYGLGAGDNMVWCEGDELTLVESKPECDHLHPSGKPWLDILTELPPFLTFDGYPIHCPKCGDVINSMYHWDGVTPQSRHSKGVAHA